MTINVVAQNGKQSILSNVKNYDFYPETRLIFADCGDTVCYIPIDNNATIEISGGTERGYLEGHDEAR